MAKIKLTAKQQKILYYGLLGVLVLIFIASAAGIAAYFIESNQSGKRYDELGAFLEEIRSTMDQDTGDNTPNGGNSNENNGGNSGNSGSNDPDNPQGNLNKDPNNSQNAAPKEPVMLADYKQIYDINNDTVGWITMPGIKVNYPVVQTPNDPDYYLDHDFYKRRSDWGAIYAEEACDINRPSDNIILYGHHMKDGSMFASLLKFQQKEFWETHQKFVFDTLYERHQYRIWAVFKITGDANNGFPYHQFIYAATQKDFDDFVSTAKSLSFYDTGITPEYGDYLLTLSTCEYTLENGRFVVCAVRTD